MATSLALQLKLQQQQQPNDGTTTGKHNGNSSINIIDKNIADNYDKNNKQQQQQHSINDTVVAAQ